MRKFNISPLTLTHENPSWIGYHNSKARWLLLLVYTVDMIHREHALTFYVVVLHSNDRIIPLFDLMLNSTPDSYSSGTSRGLHAAAKVITRSIKGRKASLWVLQRTFQKLISVHLRRQLAVSTVKGNKRWLFPHSFRRAVWKQHSWEENLI